MVHEKHVYANPLDPLLCPCLGLGVWFCLNQGKFVETEKLFLQNDTKEGAASARYCGQLTKLLADFVDIVKNYVRVDHANTHGVRKGSATYVTSGTTCPPSTSSIANRGEWSLGKVLDVYWHFSAPGDSFLGRCLCGLNPSSSEFGMLPPHWILQDPLANDDIKEAMIMMYGSILDTWKDTANDPTGVLLLCLASVVHHSGWLQTVVSQSPSHPFNAIPLLNNSALIDRLQTLVTCNKTDSMKVATGIPPHIEQAITMQKLLTVCTKTLETVCEQTIRMKETMTEALEERALQSGNVTGARLEEMLVSFRDTILTEVTSRIEELKASGCRSVFEVQEEHREAPAIAAAQRLYRPFVYKGKFWDVPEDFEFPAGVTLDIGWKLWLTGLPQHQVLENDVLVNRPIKPFRKFQAHSLPKKVADTFKLHWRPLYQMMETELEIPGDSAAMVSEQITEAFTIGSQYMKSHVSYIFSSPQFRRNSSWTVATWSKHIKRSSIERYGTTSDKENLPEATRYNCNHRGPKRTRNVEPKARTKRARREPPPIQA